MKNMIENQEEILKLNHIRLTPGMINIINTLQTGGSNPTVQITDEQFDNSGITDWFALLDELQHFLMWIYMNDNNDEQASLFMQQFVTIEYLRDHFESFKVPIKKQ